MTAEKKEAGQRLSYKFRLYPTPEQERYFATNFGCCRYVYNYFLRARINAYETTKPELYDGTPNPTYDPAARPLSYYDTSRMLTQLKKATVDEDGHRWLYDADAVALVYALRNLDKAYQNFFRRVKQGENPGFPKFKSRYSSRQSFTVGGCRIDREGFAVILPKVGRVDADIHREVKGEVVSATISKNAADEYYIAVNVKGADITPLPANDNAVGITMGVRKWVTTSDGQVFDNPQVTKKMERKLAREQRKLARKQKGSANYQKQKLKVARVHNKIANKRAYETHCVTRQLVNENGVIVTREMSSADMVQSVAEGKKLPKAAKAKMNRAIADANFAELNRQLSYKAEWAGRSFVLVPSDAPTAQVCASCGYKHAELAEDLGKEWECPQCHAVRDRKYNGAKNVLAAGLDILRGQEESHITKRAREGREERERKRSEAEEADASGSGEDA